MGGWTGGQPGGRGLGGTRELTNGCSGLGGFFESIHLRIHGSKTGLIGEIVISETYFYDIRAR